MLRALFHVGNAAVVGKHVQQREREQVDALPVRQEEKVLQPDLKHDAFPNETEVDHCKECVGPLVELRRLRQRKTPLYFHSVEITRGCAMSVSKHSTRCANAFRKKQNCYYDLILTWRIKI